MEPRAKGVCSGKEWGIVVEGLGWVVCQVVFYEINCSLFPVAFVLVSIELEGLSYKIFCNKMHPKN